MSFRNVSLGKLLKAIYADRSTRISMLRTDIRNQIRKDAGESSRGGGDFYVPFWADAKNHAAGKLDLEIATDDRVEANKRRTGLYPKLQEGFLSWWRENRRQINEPFNIVTENVKAKKDFPELGVVRIENTLSFTIGQDDHRIICPYFYEEPPISDEAARIFYGLCQPRFQIIDQLIFGY